ncbi:WD40 repeat-like protein [Rickenella mellea]|uniref:WD40 repeat-like protein n=1 Tax=Rickenella mellea TaxID=50990 RepID=A0A4Y7PUI5_9AGAM|nr:WD40 repeat-like protein [Rickenella mellea]
MANTLPIITVQHDFRNVISDVQDGTIQSEDFWVSCYKTGSQSVHGKVGVSRGQNGAELESRLGVQFDRTTGAAFNVACAGLSIPPTRVRLPRQVIRDPQRSDPLHPHQINAFDVSPDRSQIAVGYNDGSIHLQPGIVSPQNYIPKSRKYKPHVASITSLRFFPSSRVLLSAGADFSLTILDADPTSSATSSAKESTEPARTLKGHHRVVTDTAIIGRGRNVLSCAKDGTVRLWDVGGGTQIRMMGSARYTPVLKMSLGDKGDSVSESPQAMTPNEKEVDTADKRIFCALGDGSFEVFDLSSKVSIYHSEPGGGGSLTAISFNASRQLLATGSSKGVTTIYDTRVLDKPLTSWSRNSASIEDLSFVVQPNDVGNADLAGPALVVATEDGLPYVANVNEKVDVQSELIGGDCIGVRVVRADSTGGIWTAGDDGIVRMY